MKIIDKRKDYYDYLTGVYGVDEKLILDRRSMDAPLCFSVFKLYIAGYIIEGLDLKGKFYYGEDLRQFQINKKVNRLWLSTHWKRDYESSIEIEYGQNKLHSWIYIKPIVDKDEINNRFGCPILIEGFETVYKFPLLKNFNLASFIPPETIYKWLEKWLSNRISKLEYSKELPNDLKIESKGFDKITSFRPNIKI